MIVDRERFFLHESRPRITVIVLSGALAIAGTSSAAPTRAWDEPYFHDSEATTSGAEAELGGHQRALNAIIELRRLSGLTWDHLAKIFGVSRRTLHFWASGKPMNASNEARLLSVLDVVRDAYRGDARSTRASLLHSESGTTALELLATQRFNQARARLGSGGHHRRSGLTALSPAAQHARLPLAPEELVDARHDRVDHEVGRTRPARTLRSLGRGNA
jgi:DNA-binding transcriptional regulator YiaG